MHCFSGVENGGTSRARRLASRDDASTVRVQRNCDERTGPGSQRKGRGKGRGTGSSLLQESNVLTVKDAESLLQGLDLLLAASHPVLPKNGKQRGGAIAKHVSTVRKDLCVAV